MVFSGTNALGSATNSYLALANVQPAQAGAYTVVVSNLLGAVTSVPALLSVIPPVERQSSLPSSCRSAPAAFCTWSMPIVWSLPSRSGCRLRTRP